MHTSGLVFDLYDDYQGEVLRDIYPSMSEVPDLVKEASKLSDSELSDLPDSVFALVAPTDSGMIRKYACSDPGHTVLSVEYFLKTAHKLPEDTRQKVASNLMQACEWYGLQPPAGLQKTALIGALMAVPTALGAKDQAKKNLANMKQHRPGAVVSPFSKHAQMAGGAMQTMQPQAMPAPTPPIQPPPPMPPMASQTSQMPMAGAPSKPAMNPQPTPLPKTAEVTFTPVMPASTASIKPTKRKAPIKTAAQKRALLKQAQIGHLVSTPNNKDAPPDTDTDATKGVELVAREKTFRHGMDLRGKEKPQVQTTEKVAQHVALGRYPMDHPVQIKIASMYFHEHGEQFSPEERREFCCMLTKRAEAAGIADQVSYDARKYGGDVYAPPEEIKISFDMRKALVSPDQAEILDSLLEKRATVSADVFCEALSQLDQEYGLHHHYGANVPDPYWSTYSTKLGWNQQGDERQSIGTETITKNELLAAATPTDSNSILDMLEEVYSREFRDEFRKDPIGIFESLPLEQKVFIARFITDNHPASMD